MRRVGVIECCALVALASLAAHAAPAGATTPVCEGDASWGESTPDKALEMFALVNAHRASLDLPAFLFSPSLGDSASWKSMHMAEYEYLVHDDPGSPIARSWQQRLRDCGYEGTGAENIAYGSGSAAETLRRWLASPGHRAHIEGPTFRVIGIGVARSDAGLYYWTQDFGTEVDAETVSPGPTTANDDPEAPAEASAPGARGRSRSGWSGTIHSPMEPISK